jgi:hypothetical protein
MPLRRVSKKRAEELKIYYSLADYVLSQRPYCEFPSSTGAATCMNPATQIHHMRGRAGPLLCDVRFWLAVCDKCHKYIHEHGKEARKRGVLGF